MLKIRNCLPSYLILLISFLSISLITTENLSTDDLNGNPECLNYQIESSSTPNSKPLLINQFATTSDSFFPLSLPTDVHFTLAEDWISNNVTIYYDGLSIKKTYIELPCLPATANKLYDKAIYKNHKTGRNTVHHSLSLDMERFRIIVRKEMRLKGIKLEPNYNLAIISN